MTIKESKITNPNDFVGLSVIVTPKEWDSFYEFEGTIIGVKDPYFQVKDQDDVYDVEANQIDITEGQL